MVVSLLMHSSVVLLMATINIVTAQKEGCSVCGPGLEVGSPDEIFEFPGQQPAIPCGDLEEAGNKLNLFNQSFCPFLPDLVVDVCNCGPAPAPTPTTFNPTAIPQPPVFGGTPTPAGAAVVPACNMCRQPGYTIKYPYGGMSVPGFLNGASILCYNIEQQAALGIFDEATCALLPDLVDESCGGCIIGAPTTHLSTAPSPTQPPAAPVGNSSSSNSNTGNIFQQSYFWFLVLGLGTLAGSICVCFLRTKNTEIQARGVGMAPTAAGTNNTEDSREGEQAAAQLEAKLRPLVLQTLFPEQKGSIPKTSISLGLVEDDENDLREQAPCSICLETLDRNASVVVGSSCSHVYHRDCIIQWLSKKVSTNKKQYHDDCPNCRQRMWDPDTYQLAQESLIRQQEQEQPLPMSSSVVDDVQEVEV